MRYFEEGGAVFLRGDLVHFFQTRSTPISLIRWLTAQRVTSALFATPVAETVIHEKWPSNHWYINQDGVVL